LNASATYRRLLTRAACCVAVLFVSLHAAAENIHVNAAVEKQEVFTGEAFIYQIQVQGTNDVAPPDLSGLDGFTAQYLGGRENNSQSISIVNGQMSRVVRHEYNLSWRLTPQREGRLTIPGFTVTAAGKKFTTQAIPVMVRKPRENDQFKLRCSLSKKSCYAGEPVTLTVKWYLSNKARSVAFSVPGLNNDTFTVHDVEVQQQPNREYYKIPVNEGEAIGVMSREQLEGETFTVLTFQKIIIPRRAGVFTLSEATVSAEVLTGYQRRNRQSDDFFDRFFDDTPFGRRGVYRTLVTPSNSLELEVKPLPEQGRPPGFNGLVGMYAIEARANPVEANVGDPITLTVTVTGPDFMENVSLPSLRNHPEMQKRFRIPKEMAEGEVQGNRKVFTQTIRPLDASVSEVPPVELPWFDSAAGEYRVARSRPIPLTVHETRVLTAQDAEGTAGPRMHNPLTLRQDGIAHNYEDTTVLVDKGAGPGAWLRTPGSLALVFGPPLAWSMLALAAFYRRRDRELSGVRRRRRALARFETGLNALDRQGEDVSGDVLELLREYFGAKFGAQAGALTGGDAERLLAARNIEEEIRIAVRKLFETCEAAQYAGMGGDAAEYSRLFEEARETLRRLDREAGK
jgi:hypothetical protein